MSLHRLDTLAIENPAEEPLSENMVDESETTCFGFEDRLNKVKTSAEVKLNVHNQFQPLVNVKFNTSVNCAELMGEVMVSTVYDGNGGCPYSRKCHVISVEENNTRCVVKCLCKSFPCEFLVLFQSTFNAKICDLKIE